MAAPMPREPPVIRMIFFRVCREYSVLITVGAVLPRRVARLAIAVAPLPHMADLRGPEKPLLQTPHKVSANAARPGFLPRQRRTLMLSDVAQRTWLVSNCPDALRFFGLRLDLTRLDRMT